MTLSKRGDYVLRSALCLARAYPGGESRKIREVVAEMEVPQTFASQILADLVKANLAVSKAGRDGGYRLSRPPDAISVLEIVEAGEGPLRAERCALGEGPCRWESVCPMHETWGAATAALREVLATATLAELVARDAALEAGSYEIPVDSHRQSGRPVNVRDDVHLELSLDLLPTLLAHSTSIFSPAVRSSHTEAARLLLADAGLDGPPTITMRFGTPVHSGESLSLNVAWETEGVEVATGFDAEFTFTALDPDRSAIHLDGTWEARLTRTGDRPGPKDLDAAARSVMRLFLRELTRTAEQPLAASAVQLPDAPAGS